MFLVDKIRKLWYNRPKARLMRECLAIAARLLKNTETLELILKEKGYIK